MDAAVHSDPVVVDMRYYFYGLEWASEPLPEEAPEGYYDNAPLDISDPEVAAQVRMHILNGRHFIEHFTRRLITQSGVALECDYFDTTTRLCTAHNKRPPICAGYPWYEGTKPLKDGGILPPACSYWADVELSKRPPDWRPIDIPEMAQMIERGELDTDWQGTRAVAQSLNKE